MFRCIAIGAILFNAVTTFAATPQTPPVESKPKPSAPTLVVGSDAPSLTIEKWVKGTAVPKFEKGNVYLVEFWAPSSMPSMMTLSDLSDLQKKYSAQKLTVIGVTTADPKNTLADVEKTLAEKGDQMNFTIAWDDATKSKDAFLTAADRTKLPCVFLVEQTGKVAYIGSPMASVKVLDDVIVNKHDMKVLAAEYKRDQEFAATLMEYGAADKAKDWPKALEACDKLIAFSADEPDTFIGMKLLILTSKMKDDDKAYAYIHEVHKGIGKSNARVLITLAAVIVSPGSFKKQDLDLALTLALDANTLAQGKDAEILDALASIYFQKGDVPKAIEVQTKAVESAAESNKPKFQRTLDKYRSPAEKKSGGG